MSVTYEKTNQITNRLIQSIVDERIRAGYNLADANSFTLGYIQSMMNTIILDMSKRDQIKVLTEIARISTSKELT